MYVLMIAQASAGGHARVLEYTVSSVSKFSSYIYCNAALKFTTHFLLSGDEWRSTILDLKVVLIYIMHHNFLTATTGTLAD